MYKFVQWSFFRFVNFNSSYTTGFSFILVPTVCLSTIISISYRRARQFTNLSAAPVSGTVSVANVR